MRYYDINKRFFSRSENNLRLVRKYNLKNNYPVVGNKNTPIAYTATALVLATHTHPIQAFEYVFSDEAYLQPAMDFDYSLDVASAIISDYELPVYETIGDLSGVPQLIGHLESLATSIGEALQISNRTLNEMNVIFEEQQIWETLSCVGKDWVANGIEWSANTLIESFAHE